MAILHYANEFKIPKPSAPADGFSFYLCFMQASFYLVLLLLVCWKSTAQNKTRNDKKTMELSGNDSSCFSQYYQLAKKDIEDGSIKLIIIGGGDITGSFSDPVFEKKYHIQYITTGCVRFEDDDCLIYYNRLIMKYLEKKYGNKWRDEVLKSVAGLEKSR